MVREARRDLPRPRALRSRLTARSWWPIPAITRSGGSPPGGVVTTIAGDGISGYVDGPSTQARFNAPVGVAVDAAGRIIVADTYNDRVRVIDPDGHVRTLAGGDDSTERPGR